MVSKFKNYYEILKMNPWWIDHNELCATRMFISIVLGCAAFIMLILNLINQSNAMSVTSVVLVVGFLFSAISAGVVKNANLSAEIMAVLVCFVMSYFAVSGGNEGFAILWTLLVPLFAVSLLGVKTGMIVVAYFAVFTAVLFWSPLEYIVDGKYTDSFTSKYPILFTCDCIVSVFLSLQREYYIRKVHLQANVDGLTGVYNRRYFSDYVINERFSPDTNDCIMVIDVNGLKRVNDYCGHEAGDELICAVPECCRKVLGNKGTICRIGGDEFVLKIDMTESMTADLVKKLREESQNWKGRYSDKLSFSIGWATAESNPKCSFVELFNKADQNMYADKSSFYRQSCNNRRNR